MTDPDYMHRTLSVIYRESTDKGIPDDAFRENSGRLARQALGIESLALDNYYVTLRSVRDDHRRTERFSAESFADAVRLCVPLMAKDEEIIQIERDYKV